MMSWVIGGLVKQQLSLSLYIYIYISDSIYLNIYLYLSIYLYLYQSIHHCTIWNMYMYVYNSSPFFPSH